MAGPVTSPSYTLPGTLPTPVPRPRRISGRLQGMNRCYFPPRPHIFSGITWAN
jgi:hypothetical protein